MTESEIYDKPFENRLFSNIRGSLRKSIDYDTRSSIKKSIKLGIGLGVGALAVSMFMPNQSAYLGHMPGTGGEYWDWTSATNEQKWAPLMESSLDFYNQNTVHVRKNKKYSSQPSLSRGLNFNMPFTSPVQSIDQKYKTLDF
jgi:hypothetical protein